MTSSVLRKDCGNISRYIAVTARLLCALTIRLNQHQALVEPAFVTRNGWEKAVLLLLLLMDSQ
jgi:hypothetical protein